jgi:hypothetical protein
MTPRFVMASLAALLALVVVVEFATAAEHEAPLVGFLALLLLLELPAAWWRLRGGSAPGTWAVAIGPPLLLGSAFLLYSHLDNQRSCGDMCGIEGFIFLILLVLVLVTGSIVAALAMLLVEPREES